MSVEVREAAGHEHAEAGTATAAAYEPFVRDDWGDYLARIADVAGRARHATVLVAVVDDAIVGSLTLEVDGRVPGSRARPPLRADEAHVRMLGVRPDAQSRGVGRALMEEAQRRAWASGKREITLHTTAEMVTARRMYEQLGYARRPHEDIVFPDGFVLLGYGRRLEQPGGADTAQG